MNRNMILFSFFFIFSGCTSYKTSITIKGEYVYVYKKKYLNKQKSKFKRIITKSKNGCILERTTAVVYPQRPIIGYKRLKIETFDSTNCNVRIKKEIRRFDRNGNL